MFQPGMGNDSRALMFRRWAADNGCYAGGDRFDAGDWLEWLAGLRRYRARCVFAVAPDVVGDARATLERSRPYLATVRQLGYAAALTAQDGAENICLPWDDVDALFIGGTNSWRDESGAPQRLIAEARARGKWTHWGRVNTEWAMARARVAGCDSVDGTFLVFGPDKNLPILLHWLDGGRCEYQEKLL